VDIFGRGVDRIQRSQEEKVKSGANKNCSSQNYLKTKRRSPAKGGTVDSLIDCNGKAVYGKGSSRMRSNKHSV